MEYNSDRFVKLKKEIDQIAYFLRQFDVRVFGINEGAVQFAKCEQVLDICVSAQNELDIVSIRDTLVYQHYKAVNQYTTFNKALLLKTNYGKVIYRIYVLGRKSEDLKNMMMFTDWLKYNRTNLNTFNAYLEDIATKYQNDLAGFLKARREYVDSVVATCKQNNK